MLEQYPGKESDILNEMNHVAIHQRVQGNFDIESDSAVSLTARALLGPWFPEDTEGIRYLYAVHTPLYYDLFKRECQLRIYTSHSDFEQKAVRFIGPGYVFAALKCELLYRDEERKEAVYKVYSPIIWNPDIITDPSKNPDYAIIRDVIIEQFERMIQKQDWRISVERLKSGDKRVVVFASPEYPECEGFSQKATSENFSTLFSQYVTEINHNKLNPPDSTEDSTENTKPLKI